MDSGGGEEEDPRDTTWVGGIGEDFIMPGRGDPELSFSFPGPPSTLTTNFSSPSSFLNVPAERLPPPPPAAAAVVLDNLKK